ncbi:MAG: BamA/TamA family outer membrane protein, partial [bacterium]
VASRLDYGVTLFHVVNFFQTQFGLERFRNLGVDLAFSYPLSRFKRVELSANLTQLRDDNLFFIDIPTKVTNTLPITLTYVSDNTLFRFFGPFTGARYRAGVIVAPSIGSKSRTFQAGLMDFRHYFGITRDIGFAWRVSGGASGGRNPMRFLLGGLDNWLDREFASNLDTAQIADFYFSNFVTPLRGADYYEQIGTRYFLVNVELRFPLVDYFITRFPLPLGFAGIRGAGFLDVGSAWNSDKRFRATQKNAQGETVLRDLIAGYGWGFRANLGIFLLRMDAVWRTNLAQTRPPEYLFSFGTDF